MGQGAEITHQFIMTGTAFTAYVRKKTKSNTATFTDADIVAFANAVKDDIAERIATDVDEHYFEIELTRDLEADVRDYTFPNDLLKHIRHAQAKLDGTNWLPLDERDLSQIDDVAILEESKIASLYSGESPEYYISGRGLTLLSGDAIEAVSGGLKLLGEVYPEDIDTDDLASATDLSVPSTDETHRLPRAVHKHWADMVVIEYKESRDKPMALTKKEQRIDISLAETLSKLVKRNTARTFNASVPTNNGENY
jgi:predicted DNA binding CopG/RHH family protein